MSEPFEHDMTQHTNKELVEYLQKEAEWVRKEAKYLSTELNRDTPMPARRAESIEERLDSMAEMASVMKERRENQ